jgi:hypothetical protein
VGQPDWESPLGSSKHRWNDNIKTDLNWLRIGSNDGFL